jgi:hypothetical protein
MAVKLHLSVVGLYTDLIRYCCTEDAISRQNKNKERKKRRDTATTGTDHG